MAAGGGGADLGYLAPRMSFWPYFLQLRPSSRGVTSWTALTLTWVLRFGSVFLRSVTAHNHITHSASARVRAPHREKAPGARDGAHAQAHGDGGRGRANTASSRAYVSRLPLEAGLAWTSLHLPSRSSSGNPLGCWLPFPLAIAIHLLPAPTTGLRQRQRQRGARAQVDLFASVPSHRPLLDINPR